MFATCLPISLTRSLAVHPRALLSSTRILFPPLLPAMKRSHSQIMASDSKVHKVIIVGSGPRLVPLLSYKRKPLAERILASPSGHTAAIYAARANLQPILFEGFLAGGVAAGESPVCCLNHPNSQQCEFHFGFSLVQVASSPPPPILRTSPGSLMASWAPRSWRT